MTTKTQPVQTALKTKTTAVVAPLAVAATHTTTYVPTTAVTATKPKTVTTNPVIGKAKY
jgi:hypothetical protein